jgi:hypothetical protein
MKSPSVFIVPALFTLLTACATSPAPPSPGEPPSPGANQHTQVLTASSRALLTSYDPASGTMTYGAGDGALTALVPGDIVAAEPSPAAPYGYLRKVTSVNVSEGVVKLETQQASLDEAVDTGTLTASREITVADLSGPVITAPGVTFSSGSGLTTQQIRPQATAAKSFNFTFDNVLFDGSTPGTSDGQVRVNGTMNVAMRLNLNADIRAPTGLDSLLASVTLDEHSQLAFNSKFTGRVSREVSIGSASFNAFTFFIAGVPVTVSPSINFVLATDGTVSAKLNLRAVHDFHAEVGASYTAANGWKNLNGLTNNFTTDPPDYAGAMNGHADAGADFALGFYAKSPSIFGLPEFNLAGASFQAKGRGYAGLDADLKRDPQWKVFAGITADVGMNATVFSRQIANYQTRVLDFRRELSSGNPAPVTLADPANFMASATTSAVTLKWDAVPGATGYLIERRTGSGTYAEIDRESGTSTSFSDTGVTPGTVYTYRLHTLGNGVTSPGTEATATTPNPLPAPSTFTAETRTPTDITLRWTGVSGASGYLLERRSGTADYALLIRLDGGAIEYGDGGLNAGTTYSYRLRAIGTNGPGASIEATATTSAVTVLPVIGNPSPANLTLSAPVNGFATATVTYSNLGGGTLNADANGSDILSVLSNTPRPLAPGQTATVSLKATCPATAGVYTGSLIITANDSRIPAKTVPVSLNCAAPLPGISDPSPSSLNLTAPVSGSASAKVAYSNTGGSPLSADANPGNSWLNVVSNTPKPLAPAATAIISLTASCPATAGTLNTTLIITANDSRIPARTVPVTLNCTDVTPAAPLSLNVSSVGNQSVPPFGTSSNPAVVSGTVSVSGTVQAGANPVSRVQVYLVGNGAPTLVGEKAVMVPAGAKQDNITEANLDTTALPDATYTFFVRAIDSTGASADSAPVSVKVSNTTTSVTTSEIRQITTGTPAQYYLVNPGEAPVPLSGTTKVLARLNGGSSGYNGYVYLCLQRGSSSTPVGVQSANIQTGATYDFGYTWETQSSGNTPAGVPYDNLFLSGSRACDSVSDPATTSVIRVTVSN